MIFGYFYKNKKSKYQHTIKCLLSAGCHEIFIEESSEITERKIKLTELIQFLKRGDVLILTSFMDFRIFPKQLNPIMTEMQKKGIHLKTLVEKIDTNLAPHHWEVVDKAFKMLYLWYSEIARKSISTTLHKGKRMYRNRGMSKRTIWKIALAEKLYIEDQLPVNEICKQVGLSTSTLYQHMEFQRINNKKQT